MKNLIEIKIKDMFTAYSSRFGQGHYQYYCNECNQRFAVDWNIRANYMNSWIPRGSYVRCPYCGQLHYKNIGYSEKNEFIPYKLNLKVLTLKKAVVLKVEYEAIAFMDKLFNRDWSKGKEVFRFDIETGESTLTKEVSYKNPSRKYEERVKESVTYPLNEKFANAILENSVLKFLCSNSIANSENRSQLVTVMKILREEVIKKVKDMKGINTGSLYINAFAHKYGAFLLPIFNIAYRLKHTNNLTSNVEFKDKIIQGIYTVPNFNLFPADWISEVHRHLGKGTDMTNAMIISAKIPMKDQVKKIVSADYKLLGNLKSAFHLCKNYDLAIRLHNAIKIDGNVLRFLSLLKEKYNESSMVRFVENKIENQINDCIQLYNCLNEENKQLLIERKIRIRDLHDLMADMHKKQEHKNVNLGIPEHIVKRLSMQLDKVQFIIPRESQDLLEIGIKLHNCVASYKKEVIAGNKQIVAVMDDKGRVIACLEVVKDSLVQAKITRNKQVRLDNEINQKVLDWAKEVNLKIETSDINTIPIDNNIAEAV